MSDAQLEHALDEAARPLRGLSGLARVLPTIAAVASGAALVAWLTRAGVVVAPITILVGWLVALSLLAAGVITARRAIAALGPDFDVVNVDGTDRDALREALANADAVLVRDVLSGRRDCFDTLIERYYQAAYAVAYSRTGNAADAQDVTQEAFLRAFSTLNTLRDLDRFGAWLTGIARNVARNITRSAARELPRESASGEAAVEPNVESKDLHEFLRRQLATP